MGYAEMRFISAVTTGTYAYHMGASPLRHRYDTGTTPEQAGGGKPATLRRAATKDGQAEGKGSFGSA